MSLASIYEQVPAGYYYYSLRSNLFQRYWHTQRFKMLRRLLKGRKGKLLDIGCADGVFTNELSQVLYPTSTITAIDIYKPSIQFARKKYPHITFKQASAEKLPFANKAFHMITCLEMLEHVENPNQVLKEMKRVLKKNGSIIILVPQEILRFQIIWYIWTKFKGKVWHHAHRQHFYLDSLSSYFEQQGFIIKFKATFIYGMLMVFELTLK